MRQLDDRAEQVGLGHSLFAVLLIGLMTAGVLQSTGGDGSLTSSTARELYRVVDVQEKVGPRRGIACPAGSVLLRRARNIQKVINSRGGRTTFCFQAKTYFLRKPIVPKSYNTFVGKSGAVLDGSRWQTSDLSLGAFSGAGHSIDYVTIRNLVIRNMPQSGIATAYGTNSHWNIDHNEISGSRVGIAIADQFRVTNNFIHDNRQYGFTGFRATGFLFQDNEVTRSASCGCWSISQGGGGSKLVRTTNLEFVGNYFHDNWNHDLHFDTGNTGVLIAGNTFVNSGNTPIAMETNTGTAIIRNNKIVVSSQAADGIVVNNSSNEQIYNNTLSFAGYSIGIRLWFDSSRIDPATGRPYDLANNTIHDNTITLQGSARYAAGINCTADTNCSPYWTTKGNVFQGNTYRGPSQIANSWVLSSAVAWLPWQAVGFDTTGSLVS